jgi:energy-converting hydrogenase Eha subunit G
MREPRHHKELNAASAESGGTSWKLWVVAVLAFWISAGVTLAVMLTTGKLDLILVSITLGMMVLGVWLKARYQLRQRKARGRVSDGDSV